jgi:hypothetical protein
MLGGCKPKMSSSDRRRVISDLTELPSVRLEIRYANEQMDIYNLSHIQLPHAKGRLKAKKFSFTSVQIFRGWWQRRCVKWRWFESSSLVNVTDGLLDADGTMVDVPAKRLEESSKEVSGMWFGPRLGKRSKRSVDSPWTVLTVRGKFVFYADKILGSFRCL